MCRGVGDVGVGNIDDGDVGDVCDVSDIGDGVGNVCDIGVCDGDIGGVGVGVMLVMFVMLVFVMLVMFVMLVFVMLVMAMVCQKAALQQSCCLPSLHGFPQVPQNANSLCAVDPELTQFDAVSYCKQFTQRHGVTSQNAVAHFCTFRENIYIRTDYRRSVRSKNEHLIWRETTSSCSYVCDLETNSFAGVPMSLGAVHTKLQMKQESRNHWRSDGLALSH
jgi:hypothetical protein